MRIIHNGKAILAGLEKIDTKLLDSLPNLKVIGCNCTGLDHIDLVECEKRGIEVISLQGKTEFTETVKSTAEHTMGLIIALSRNYRRALNEPYKHREKYIGHTLGGKTLGIIGYGRVGKQLAKIADGFGMINFVIDKSFENINTNEITFVIQSDIVSLHIPLVGNEGFFTKDMFKQMKPTAVLINTSRDKIIEKGALVWALENGIIAGAAVDFIDDEELLHYARDQDNLILTPHIGGATYEDLEKTEKFIEDRVEKYLNK